ncbi:hypothetical protein BU16DRAFT_580481 [Lophium mytilinum]|uniref:RING-type domain-containing protein n=1 Tax=Lophium mytilinum TaxID=390894 RepID=A0A6A6R0M2_9PEZI|nr:hypothetical protein BU16DRAFT_580481 [Lophium mytilinum]
MAASDIASSFAPGDIPVKLRCAIDSKLVVNAFRLPCCDQNICGSCQSALPESCPVCAHSPLSADACQPSKGLRLTVSAFIKKEEKKREKERAANNTPKPAAVADPVPLATASSSEQAPDNSDQAVQSVETSSSQQDNSNLNGASAAEVGIAGSEAPVDDNQALEQQTLESTSLPQPLDARRGSTAQAPVSTQSVERTSAAPESQSQDAQNGVQSGSNTEGQDPSAMWNMNGGQGQMYPGAFGNFNNGMDWSGTTGFNPMMQMPNGMNSGDWNNYSSMMGMPGMNMGPMSQGMFGGFGGQGMGMSGMAGMNMGMNYGGGYGTGWNGQQMSGGDFGGANAGYYPGGGYNQSSQGNFPHQMHQQQFPKNNFQNQNRFQGQGAYPQRGGFGRGHQGNLATQNQGQAYGQNQVPTSQNHSEQKHDDTTDRQTSSGLQDSSIRMTVEQSQAPPDTEADGVEGAPEKASDSAENPGLDASTGNSDIKAEGEQNANSINASGSELETNEIVDATALTRPAEEFAEDTSMNANMDTPTQQFQPIATVDTSEPFSQPFDHQNMNMNMNMGMGMGMSHDMMGQVYPGQPHQMGMMDPYSHRGRGGARGGFGRGVGHDFRGGFGGRGVQGGGFMATGAFGGSNTAVLPHSGDVTVLTPGEPRGLGVEGAPTGPKAMREGRPNTGFASRGRFSGPHVSGAPHVTPDVSATGSQTRPRSKTPMRDDSLRVRSKSRSKSPVREKPKSRSPSRSRENRRHRDRSLTPTTEDGSREKYREYDNRRSSRKYNDDEREDFPEEFYREELKEKSKEDPSRGTSVESRYRSRRDREKHRSSRSHRDRSREHRRHRHRSRSRSPVVDEVLEGDENGNDLPSESSSRRKGRSEKYRDRERDRERERERDRDRETEHDRDRDRGKDRRRDRERERKHSRRDRSKSPRNASDEERHHRSSKPSHKERERDREYTRGHSQSRDHSPPITAPTGPSKAPAAETEFKIQGRSRGRGSSTVAPIATNMPPPTQPKSSQAVFQPPKGPAAERSNDRDRDRDRGSRRRPSSSVPSTPITPTTPTTPAVDPHTLEREARNRERMLKEAQRRASLQNPKSSFSSAEKKRSRDAVEDEDDKPFTPPTGPSSQRRKRRRESDTGGSSKLEDRVGGKGKKGREGRRMSYKYEDEENDEARARRLEKMEREREESRWN